MRPPEDQVLRVVCAFGRHHFTPWAVSEISPNVLVRECVRCGNRQFEDKEGTRVNSRWAAGMENIS